MNAAFLTCCLLLQADPFKVLADPALRTRDADRRAAVEALRAREGKNAFGWAAARFLEKPESAWNFTPAAAQGINAFLAKYWKDEKTAEGLSREAIGELVRLSEKPEGKELLQALRLFALAHVSALGDGEPAAKLGLQKGGDRWGMGDALTLYAIASKFERPDQVPAELENRTRASPLFGARYAGTIVLLNRAFAGGVSFKAVHDALSELSGPGKATDHCKALAASLKAAVYCTNCKAGRLPCPTCQGTRRADQPCEDCNGEGRVKSPAVISGGKMNLTMKCKRCQGAGIFKNSWCKACGQAGTVNCESCNGKPWHDGCKDCKNGLNVCSTCQGKRTVFTPCAACGGEGYVPSPAVVAGGKMNLKMKCKTCTGEKGITSSCKACGGSGVVRCSTCGGKDRGAAASASISSVYTAEKCDACDGKGWPLPNVAVPCEKCQGLGVRLKPASDATKMLE